MKTAIFKGPGVFEMTDRPIPEPGPSEVRVKIMAVGICGSDIGPYRGQDLDRREPGIVMGHEASGIVDAVGSAVTAWKPGDRVAIDPQLYCEHCKYCLSNEKNLCSNMLLIGSSKRKFLDGAMCEYLAIDQRHLLMLPDNVSFEEGAMLDPLGNAIRVVRRGRVGMGDTVVVVGCGAIGLMTLQSARIAGATQVIAISHKADDKRALAAEMGVDVYLESDDIDAAVAEIKKLTGGEGADVVIECVGIPHTYKLAVAATRKRGTVVALGYSGHSLDFPLTDFIFREINMVGSTGFSQEREMLLKYVSTGQIKLDKIITHKLPLQQVREGFELLLAGKAIKVMLLPNG